MPETSAFQKQIQQVKLLLLVALKTRFSYLLLIKHCHMSELHLSNTEEDDLFTTMVTQLATKSKQKLGVGYCNGQPWL